MQQSRRELPLRRNRQLRATCPAQLRADDQSRADRQISQAEWQWPQPWRASRELVCWATGAVALASVRWRSEEHTSELQSLTNLVCRLLLEKKKYNRHVSRRQRTKSE